MLVPPTKPFPCEKRVYLPKPPMGADGTPCVLPTGESMPRGGSWPGFSPLALCAHGKQGTANSLRVWTRCCVFTEGKVNPCWITCKRCTLIWGPKLLQRSEPPKWALWLGHAVWEQLFPVVVLEYKRCGKVTVLWATSVSSNWEW